jgi:hypothetical protein
MLLCPILPTFVVKQIKGNLFKRITIYKLLNHLHPDFMTVVNVQWFIKYGKINNASIKSPSSWFYDRYKYKIIYLWVIISWIISAILCFH